MGFLRKIQNLPEEHKKIMRLILVIIFGLLLFLLWAKSVQFKIKNFSGEGLKEQFKIPEFNEKLEQIPKLEMPKFEIPEISPKEWEKLKEGLNEEEIRQLEEMMKEFEKQDKVNK